MQNNNSKLNTILLITVIILLAIGIWMLAVNDKVSERIESDIETSVVKDVVVKEEEPEVTQSKPVDPTIVFLKGLVSTYPYAEIAECHWADGTQFMLKKDSRIADLNVVYYNEQGAIMGDCLTSYELATYTPSGICEALVGACNEVVYGQAYTQGNPNSYFVDKYYLK